MIDFTEKSMQIIIAKNVQAVKLEMKERMAKRVKIFEAEKVEKKCNASNLINI